MAVFLPFLLEEGYMAFNQCKNIIYLHWLNAMEEFYSNVKIEDILHNTRKLLANNNQYTRGIQFFVKITLHGTAPSGY